MNRKTLLGGLAAGVIGSASFATRISAATPVAIRYTTGGGIAPNEIETAIWTPYVQQNVLKNYGKAYTIDMIFTKGTSEGAQLMAAGQADIGVLAPPSLANIVAKDAIAGGVTVISDLLQEGDTNHASNTYTVLASSAIHRVEDLRGKRIGINGLGTSTDLVLRVMLRRHGLDPRTDTEIVEIPFSSMAAALRQQRIDCGVLVLPFLATEMRKGDLRPLFTNRDVFSRFAEVFQVARTTFLRSNPDAVRAFLSDYVTGVRWFAEPKNRKEAMSVLADVTKSPIDVIDSYLGTKNDAYHSPTGCLTAEMLQVPIDAAATEKFIAQSIDASKYIDLSYLPHACSSH